MLSKLETLKFDVLYSSDATRTEMFSVIGRFIAMVDLYTVLLVYYTGHGVQIDGKNYLVPIDCTCIPTKAIFISTDIHPN